MCSSNQSQISIIPSGVSDKSTIPSLDKVRNNWADSDFSLADRVKANDKFSYKISQKSKDCRNIRIQVRAFLKNQFDMDLPIKYDEFKANKSEILQGFEELEELAKSTYKMNTHVAYSVFESGKENASQVIGCLYSRHRLDPVWNYRKSQLIRKVWREYLLETKVHREFRPCHLVLTVPRNGNEFMNEEFYAKELLKCFNSLRKRTVWKNAIKGGEYGVETKRGKNKNTGLHIHIHSLCFVEWNANLNDLRNELKKAWKRVCKVDQKKNIFLHLETLYYYDHENLETSDKVVGTSETQDEYGNYEYKEEVKQVTTRKKVYVQKDSEDGEYLRGIMECMKYHFKSEDLYVFDNNGKVVKNKAGYPVVDVPLMNDILVNSKGLRFYSKFGFCYKEEKLNYDKKVNDKELDLECDLEDIEDNEVKLGNIDKSVQNIVNPFTGELALEGEYVVMLGNPCNMKHNSKSDLFEPMKPKVRGLNNLYSCDPKLTMKEIMKGLSKSDYSSILTYEAFQNFTDTGGSTFIEEKNLADIMRHDLLRY